MANDLPARLTGQPDEIKLAEPPKADKFGWQPGDVQWTAPPAPTTPEPPPVTRLTQRASRLAARLGRVRRRP
jgi:hypothetical protein